jgi:oligopeptidase B
MRALMFLFVLLSLINTSCSNDPQPPVAQIRPHQMEIHDHSRIDNYFWLKERDNPVVIEYLEAENDYTKQMMKQTKSLQEKLFNEIKDRLKPNDCSVPYRYGGFYYYYRYEPDQEFKILCRKKDNLSADEEILIDCNQLATNHTSFYFGDGEVSPDGYQYAFAVDTVGRRKYAIYFKDLVSGQIASNETITDATRNFVWANDNQTLFYTKQDPETLRWYQIYKHRLGTDVSTDLLVYQEADDTFDCSVSKSKSDDYIFIECNQTVSTEFRFLDATNPDGSFKIVQPRRRDHEYEVKHYGDRLYIRSNWNALNFRLMATDIAAPEMENWIEIIPHRPDVLISDYEIFNDYLVLTERGNALNHIRIIPWHGQDEHYLSFSEPAYSVFLTTNLEFDTTLLRYRYSSPITPRSTIDYDMKSKTRTLLKQDEVIGGYTPDDYRVERIFAPASDGALVPISLVCKKDSPLDGTAPLLLYAYGAYGFSSHASFSSAHISLLERGATCAIAHVRGGQEMGRIWYEQGRLLNKINSFTDFIACGEHLISQGYTSTDRLFCEGGSAGGLLIGAVVNMKPELFRGAIADVPFVDVITTMLDASIPLTTSEYDEWGNPNDKRYYDYMLSYSPYDQVSKKGYCNLLVLTGLHDSQVQYWEPAKWVAKLRALKTDDNLLLLNTNMSAGHGGSSGRFEYYREIALTYAFILRLVDQ